MAIIQRNKSTVYGLTTDLAALVAADAAELARATGVEGTLASLTTTVKTDLVSAINSEVGRSVAAELVLRTDLASEVTRATAAEDVLTTNLAQEVTDRAAAVAAEATRALAAEAALGVRVDNVLNNTDAVALNSLAEIVTAFQAADNDLNGAITTLAGAAGTDLTTEVTRATAAELVLTTDLASEVTRATGVEGSLAALTSSVKTTLVAAINSEVADRIAADANLDATLKAYADEAVRLGGAIPKMESLVVAADKIVLSFAPKGGIAGIVNYATVRYIDANGVAYDAPLVTDATDSTGKTFLVSVDSTGQWDGKSVQVQYSYIAVA